MRVKLNFINYVIFIFIITGVFISILIGINSIKIVSLISLFLLLLIYSFKSNTLKQITKFFIKTYYMYFILFSLIVMLISFNIFSIVKIFTFVSFGLIMYIFYIDNKTALLKINFYMLIFLIFVSLILNPPALYINPINYFLDRYHGILGVNQTAILGLFLGLYSLLFIRKNKNNFLFKITLIFSFYLIIMTGSRTSLLTLLFSMFLYKFKINKTILIFLLLIEIICIFYANDIFDIVLNFIYNNQNNTYIKLLRFDIYSIKLRLEGSLLSAYELSKNNLFMPYGFNMVNFLKEKNNIFIDNSYLSILLEMGIFGLFLFVAFLIRLIYLIRYEYMFLFFPIISILFFLENIWSFSLFNILALSLFGYALRGKQICKK